MMQEKIIVQSDARYPLKGLLTLPDERFWPCPAVVLVHGSGSSSMDEKVQKLTPFKDLAEGLAKYGIATIRYDKRSYAHGLKLVRSKECITVKQETIDDACAAVELLKQDKRIDLNKLFVLGHSMGGMLAPRIDAQVEGLSGLIIMAGSPRGLHEILLDQFDEMMQKSNRFVQWILKKQIKKFQGVFSHLDQMSDEEAKKTSLGNGVTAYYFKEMMKYPTEELLKKLQKPVLVVQGEDDFQVNVEKDYQLYQNIMKNQSNSSFKLYEGLNHCFVKSISNDIANAKNEYNTERHIPEEVIKDFADWIKSA